MKKSVISMLILVLTISGLYAVDNFDMKLFKSMKARSIGPAGMSGRITCIDVVNSNTNIIYVGSATGGLWKSENGGISWKPIFDKERVSSIGAIAINQKNPNIIWVGTGEANPRNSVGVGRGVYKSIDAGKSWKFLGLEKTEKISRIRLDPFNFDTAYVAALGTTWGENPQRGVYKTVDGGKSWKKILFVNNKTGCADLAIAPDNPNKLFAAMWEHRRWPWFFKSGGPGSALYISNDGGENWKKITEKDGMLKGELGRIGIAFSKNRPNIVYAMVEAKKNALLKSLDGGISWKTVNGKPGVNGRPFYYSDIRVNPVNENIVYSLESSLKVSVDGGRNFKNLTNWIVSHPDYHAMWNHPNGDTIIVGNDGGLVLTRDRGKNWRFIKNLPVGQFYHVSFDMKYPYNVYGGLQDNGSWTGPSMVLNDRFIFNYHWKMVGFGDGFDTEPDPDNNDCGYAMSQGGNLFYYDLKTNLSKTIRPTEGDVKDRYNWNAALAVDPFNKTTIYYGSQFVHKSIDKGKTWEIISPDLTTNDPEKQKQAQSGGLTIDATNAENHTTIVTIAPSPVKRGIIWVGTDDGNIQLTRDGGKTWALVSKSITSKKGKTRIKRGMVPYGTVVPHIEASKFNEKVAFAVFEDHQRANWTPYIFKTENFGKTWKSIATDEIDGFVHVIEQDTVNQDLLFAGTEFGLFVSFNGGKKWHKWTNGIPTVPVMDMNVHPRENDLVIGTFGRAIYIIDDISPLREINDSIFKKDFHIFNISDAYQYQNSWMPSAAVSPGSDVFFGTNKSTAAKIYFYWNKKKTEKNLKNQDKNKLKITILDKNNKIIRTLKAKPKKGLNTVYWRMNKKGIKMPGASMRRFSMTREPSGLSVFPGEYTVRFTYGKEVQERKIRVKWDPRLKFDGKDLQKRDEFALKVQKWILKSGKIYKQINSAIKSVKIILDNPSIIPMKNRKNVLKKAKEIQKKLTGLKNEIVPDMRNQKGIRDNSDLLSMKINRLYWQSTFSYYAPTQALLKQYEKVKPLVKTFMDKAEKILNKDLKTFKSKINSVNLNLFPKNS